MPPLDVILASASPRRKELLALIFKNFRVIPSSYDESLVPDDLTPPDHVMYLAKMKARDIAEANPGSLVIGADTIVVVDGIILGKPANRADAIRMLDLLSGRSHEVYTGVAIMKNGAEHVGVECTEVDFADLGDEIIARYVDTGEPLDKAGGYAIQGKGVVLIDSIRGSYPNVVGLPLSLLSNMLREFGVEPLCG